MRFAVLVVLSVAACGDSTTPRSEELVVTDESGSELSSIGFPDTAIAAGSSVSIEIINRGSQRTGALALAVTGDFVIVDDATTCKGAALDVGQGCNVVLSFQPSHAGLHTGLLTATSNPGGMLAIELTGNALAPMLTLSPANHDFGAIAVGSSAMTTIEVSNTGMGPATIDSTTVTGTVFTKVSSTCGATLVPNGTCNVVVSFSPTVGGGATGALTVGSNGDVYTTQLAGKGAAALTVTRAGTGTGTVTSTPAGINCGTTCTASFGDDVQLVAVPTAGSVFAGWSIPTCLTTTCTVSASSLPATVTATFQVANLSLSPNGYNFGTVPVGTTVTQTFRLQNNGSLPVPLDGATVTSPFVIASTTCGATLDGISFCNYVVSFTPQQIGAVGGDLDITVGGAHYKAPLAAAGAANIDVTVQGQGVVTSNPAGIDCGSTCTALFGGPVTLTATPNAGNVFSSWSVGSCTGTTCVVQPGTSVTATFAPANAYTISVDVSGLASAGLVLRNNDTDDLAIPSNGTYTFATPIASGLPYFVKVYTPPATEACRVTNGSGTVNNANVTNVLVTCAPHPWTVISSRTQHTNAIKQDGTLWAWGHNQLSQLGDGSTTDRNVPIQIGTATTWTNVQNNYYNTCAQRSDNTTWCWGDNQFGQLGSGIVGGVRAVPGMVSSANPFTTLGVGGGFMCGIQSDGSLWCWGNNGDGQVGLQNTGSYPTPTRVGMDSDWVKLGVGFFTACAIKTDGSLWCWGDNAQGTVGDNTLTDRFTPTRIGTDTWRMVIGGDWTTCGIKMDNTLWCWGINAWGNLGDGTTTNRRVPTQVGTATNWTNVASAGHTTCGIQSDGTLWCWGQNTEGEIGDGTTIDRHTPVNVAPMRVWTSVSVSRQTCALATDNSMWCWGFNLWGQLGDGTNLNTLLPQQVAP